MLLGWVTFGALCIAAITAVLLARRGAEYWPIAAFLCVVALANLIRVPLLRFEPEGQSPLEGWPRVGFHVNEALYLIWDTALVTAAICVFVRRNALPWLLPLPALGWAGTVAYLATHYPAMRGETLRDVYVLTDVAALTVGAAGVVSWTWRRVAPTPAHVAITGILFTQLLMVIGGALRYGLWDRYYLDQIVSLLAYVTLSVYQVLSWRSRSLPR